MPFLKNNVGLSFQMKISKALILFFILIPVGGLLAQTDSTVRNRTPTPQRPVSKRSPGDFKPQRAVMFRFNYTMCIPQADLAKRFGAFSSLGGSIGMKWESGWDLRAEGSFLFGRNVVEYSSLDSIRGSDGYIIDQTGSTFNPQLSLRGFTAGAHLGRLFPVGRNRNSGIFVSLGGGFIQHRLHFQSVSNYAQQLQGDYLKGYDRLTNGSYTTEFIGYQHMSAKKLVNFYVGFEFTQGRTQFARNWNYDLMASDKHNRVDNYWGIRLGWILPIYTANHDEDEFIFR
jgi:hypothetical protein